MKKSTLFAVVMAVLCLVGCGSNKDSNKEYEDSINEKSVHDRNVEMRQEEYNALCKFGIDRWETFEQYYDFINVDSNEKNLNKELEQDGVELLELRWLYNMHFDEFNINTQVNRGYIKWLYLHLHADGIACCAFNDFRHRLWRNEKDFILFYEKSHELGLVDNLFVFVALLFESDCDYCDSEDKEVWLENKMVNRYLYGMKIDSICDPNIDEFY